MELIEKYNVKHAGYHPFLIRDGWQVAQLNYMADQEIRNIRKLDIHHLTDEVFVLLKGKVVLIGAVLENSVPKFEVELMKPNLTYNIPMGTWHNIAMTKGSEVLIIEKSNTHLGDFEFFPLTYKKMVELYNMVEMVLDETKVNDI